VPEGQGQLNCVSLYKNGDSWKYFFYNSKPY